MSDNLDNGFQIRQHLFVGQSQNLQTFRLEKGVTTLICLLPFFKVMRLAVEFDDEVG